MAVSTGRLTEGDPSAKAALQDRYRQLLELSPAAMLVCDSAGVIAAANAAAARMLDGAGDGGLAGRAVADFLAPDSAPRFRELLQKVCAGEHPPEPVGVSCVASDGTAFEAELAAKGTDGSDCPAMVCVLTDLTRAGMVDGMREAAHRRLVEAIESISEGFAVYGPDGTLTAFNENYRNKIWPLLADYIRPGLTFEDIVRETIRRNVWQSTGLDIEAFVQGALERHRHVPSIHEIEYPDGRCILQSKQPTSDGGVVAIYSDITDLRRREADTAEAQERHRLLLETLPDGVAIHSAGKFAYVNPAAIRIYGARSHTEIVGRRSVDVVLPEERAETLARFEQLVAERSSAPPVEERHIRFDGRVIQVEVRHTYILWNGKPAILTVVRDLTEQKRAEHALRETERRYLSVASNLPGAVFQLVMLGDGTVTFPYISRGVVETHGIEAPSVRRSPHLLMRAIHPDDRERFSRALQESAETLSPFDVEVRNIKPDGRVVWVRALARPHRRDDGATVWDGIFADVTGRKVAEDQAAQTYRWLTEAINSFSDGFVLWDSDDRLMLWNDRFIEKHPNRDEIVRTGTPFSMLVERTAANLRPIIGEAGAAAWLAERISHHREGKGSYEMRTAIGRWLMVTERKTQEGYTVGIYTDITDRKRAQDELRESEERYRQLIQLSPDGIFVDRDGKIVFANDTAVRMFGATSADDLIGREILDFAMPDDRVAFVSRRSRAAEGQPSGFVQARYRRLDGETRHCESTVTRFAWRGEDANLVVIRDIEDRVDAEQRQAIFAAVLDQAPDAIEISESDFTLSYVNPAFERMTGFGADEVVGQTPATLLRPEDHDPEFYKAIERTLQTGAQWTGIMPARRKDGTEYQQEVSLSPVFSETGVIQNYVAIKRDITRRLRTETALRESEERYRKLLALTPDAIYVHVDKRIVLVNRAAVRVFGARDEEELIGRSIFDLIHDDFHEFAEQNTKRLLGESQEIVTYRLDQRRRRIDGSEFWANAAITPLNWQGRRGALVILRDITEQRRSNERLMRAMEDAEVANQSKSAFLAAMSHELRTPLNAVIGFSEIMLSELFGPIGDANYRQYAKDIHDSGMHLLNVINDILDLSKVEAGKVTPRFAEVDLRDTVTACVDLVGGREGTDGPGIETLFADDLPLVSADQRMIKQMAMNLLSNAVKFTPVPGRVRVRVSRSGPHAVEIAVTDTGIGISAGELAAVMEPFVQSEAGRELRQEGTGLGLPLTRSLAELHGGSFRIWSRVGFGTRAVLTLPVAPPSADVESLV